MRGEDKEALRFTGNPAPFIPAAHNGGGGLTSVLGNHADVGHQCTRGV